MSRKKGGGRKIGIEREKAGEDEKEREREREREREKINKEKERDKVTGGFVYIVRERMEERETYT